MFRIIHTPNKFIKNKVFRYGFLLPNLIRNCHYMLEIFPCNIPPPSVPMATITWGYRGSSFSYRFSPLSLHSNLSRIEVWAWCLLLQNYIIDVQETFTGKCFVLWKVVKAYSWLLFMKTCLLQCFFWGFPITFLSHS